MASKKQYKKMWRKRKAELELICSESDDSSPPAQLDIVLNESDDAESQEFDGNEPKACVVPPSIDDFGYTDQWVYSEEDSADGLPDDEDVAELVESLQLWALKHKCTRGCINEMLSLWRKHGHDVPKDARTLLKAPQTVDIQNLSSGHYVSLGLENSVQKHERQDELFPEPPTPGSSTVSGFPMPQGKFQKKLFDLLHKIHNEFQRIGRSVELPISPYSLEQLNSMEEFLDLETKLCENKEFKTFFVNQLSQIGGADTRERVYKIIARMMTNKLQEQFNMEGSNRKGKVKQKVGLEATYFYSSLKEAVLLTVNGSTEKLIKAHAANKLRNASGRKRE